MPDIRFKRNQITADGQIALNACEGPPGIVRGCPQTSEGGSWLRKTGETQCLEPLEGGEPPQHMSAPTCVPVNRKTCTTLDQNGYEDPLLRDALTYYEWTDNTLDHEDGSVNCTFDSTKLDTKEKLKQIELLFGTSSKEYDKLMEDITKHIGQDKCGQDPVTGKQRTMCSTLTSYRDTAEHARVWFNMLDDKRRDHIVQEICMKGQNMDECKCIQRSTDPVYGKVERYNADGRRDKCWWKPCQNADRFLIRSDMYNYNKCKSDTLKDVKVPESDIQKHVVVGSRKPEINIAGLSNAEKDMYINTKKGEYTTYLDDTNEDNMWTISLILFIIVIIAVLAYIIYTYLQKDRRQEYKYGNIS